MLKASSQCESTHREIVLVNDGLQVHLFSMHGRSILIKTLLSNCLDRIRGLVNQPLNRTLLFDFFQYLS